MISRLLLMVGGTLGAALFGIVGGLVYQGVDRILAARMQARIGPPLRQPFLDILKLFCKQNIVPRHAIAWMFHAAPLLALASSITILLYLPLGPVPPALEGRGDLILILYLLVVPALAMVAGGFASASPYATIGAQREMITMISYELPLATTMIALAWTLARAGIEQPFAVSAIAAHPLWGLVGPLGALGALLLLVTLLLVTPGELGRIPFDTPEAETELAGGLLVEYSGRNLALFQLAFGVKLMVMLALVVNLFFPYPLTAFVRLGPVLGFAGDVLFFLAKMLVVMLFSVSLVRVAVARFRITQVVDVYWKLLGAVSLLGLILIMVDAGIQGR